MDKDAVGKIKKRGGMEMITRTAKELGITTTYRNTFRYGLRSCVDCGRERWSRLVGGKHLYQRCRSCTNAILNKSNRKRELKPSWKGGRTVDGKGYVFIKLYPSDPYYPMANTEHYVREHRLVIAKHLGRLLEHQETPHHRGTQYPMGSIEDRGDNRIENLWLFPYTGAHSKYHSSLRKSA